MLMDMFIIYMLTDMLITDMLITDTCSLTSCQVGYGMMCFDGFSLVIVRLLFWLLYFRCPFSSFLT